LLRRLVPALLDHAEAFGHQLGHRRIAGHVAAHLGDLLLPKVEIARGEALKVWGVGHAKTIEGGFMLRSISFRCSAR